MDCNSIFKTIWKNKEDWFAPPLVAGAAIIPPYYLFMAKSDLQLGNVMPKFRPRQVISSGVKAAPVIGGIVGTQMIAQKGFEVLWNRYVGKRDAPTFTSMLMSSLAVGTISVVPLAWFNGLTMGLSLPQVLRALTWKQSGAILVRETSFLGAIRISDPVSNEMKRKFGDNHLVDVISYFISGFFGSIVGHPADTALTRWQKGLKVEFGRQLLKGAGTKAFAAGTFTLLYKEGMNLVKLIASTDQ